MSGISFRELDPHDRYKLLCGVVVPRPIALVTTTDENGSVNAAPFSFFNVFSEDPPLLVLGLQHKADFSPKDTTRNIQRSGQFVVHLVDEALAAAMNECAIDFPSGDSEVEATGLETLPSIDIAVPRLAAAPFALECRQHVALAFGTRPRASCRRGVAPARARRPHRSGKDVCRFRCLPADRTFVRQSLRRPARYLCAGSRKSRRMARA
jgi:flavin reductase (DIM6/NTAB) family NADH-FMN oxidoreductase RutF